MSGLGLIGDIGSAKKALPSYTKSRRRDLPYSYSVMSRMGRRMCCGTSCGMNGMPDYSSCILRGNICG